MSETPQQPLPPEIDDLMWQVAESADPDAVPAFLGRYPEHHSEMLKRVDLVAGLKASRPQTNKARAKEAFLPSPQTLGENPPRWAYVAAATVLLAGVVMATLATVAVIESRGRTPVTESRPPGLVADDRPTGDPVERASSPEPPPATIQPTSPPPLPTIPQTPDPFDNPVTIVNSRIRLSLALNDIATQAGIRLEAAPGMPDLEIALDYRNVPCKAVLDDLGRNFGFTALQQTKDSALLIPATDPTRPAPLAPGAAAPSRAPAQGTGLGELPLPALDNPDPGPDPQRVLENPE